MSRLAVLLIASVPTLAQTADRVLSQLSSIQWSASCSPKSTCQAWTPYQLAIQATDQWSYHCADKTGGIIQESFFYVFGESTQPVRFRVDLRPEDEAPLLNGELEHALSEKLTRLYGQPDNAPELFEIGFRKLRFGQPVAGEHWHAGHLHYFLHYNQSNQMPMGMRRGVELIVLDERLFEERAKDDIIHQVDGLGNAPSENDAPYISPPWKSQAERQALADQTWRVALDLLTRADHAGRDEKAKLLLSADPVVVKLSNLLAGPAELNQDPAAAAIRRRLARFGVKLGGPTHDGGLAYENDLLWRVWREFPGTEAGEMAFVRLQQRGWYSGSSPGCPANPDLFHEVIDKGEAFLAAHPNTRFRKEVLFTLAVAYESGWSIAHAPDNDAIVSAPPYPEKWLTARIRTALEPEPLSTIARLYNSPLKAPKPRRPAAGYPGSS